MRRALRTWMRDLHLYIGLAASPFVLLYAVSTIALNHPTWLAEPVSEPEVRTAAVLLQDPEDADSLALGREVLRQTGVVGEIMFVRREPEERRTRTVARRETVPPMFSNKADVCWGLFL